MNDAYKWGTELSSVSLLEAVLCADCEIISNSAGEQCEVCGSRSLLSLGRVLGGCIEGERAALVQVDHKQPGYGFTVMVNPAASRILQQRRRRKPMVTGS